MTFREDQIRSISMETSATWIIPEITINIMKLNKDGKFLPDNPVSGGELFSNYFKGKRTKR